jgi:inorganic pyrophosphatase
LGVNEIPALSSDGHVNVLVEVPKDSQNKYEYDEDLGMIVLDRALYSSVHYPTDYGFVPGTRGADGEPLDAMVIVDKSTFPGCLVPGHLLKEIEHFFEVFKDLEGSDIEVLGWEGAQEAEGLLEEAIWPEEGEEESARASS